MLTKTKTTQRRKLTLEIEQFVSVNVRRIETICAHYRIYITVIRDFCQIIIIDVGTIIA